MLFAETDFWTAFFANLPATLGALGALVMVLRQGSKISKIQHQTDGLTKALVGVSGDQAFAAGQAGDPNPTANTVATLTTKPLEKPEGTTLKDEIRAIPEVTAEKVVQKLDDKK